MLCAVCFRIRWTDRNYIEIKIDADVEVGLDDNHDLLRGHSAQCTGDGVCVYDTWKQKYHMRFRDNIPRRWRVS